MTHGVKFLTPLSTIGCKKALIQNWLCKRRAAKEPWVSNNPYEPPNLPDDFDEDQDVSMGIWPDIIFVVAVGAILLYSDYMVTAIVRILQGRFS